MKREPLYSSEAALCADFITWAATKGWKAYPEAAGFDILLVDQETGRQAGVQAKLTFNAKVISQIIPEDFYYSTGDTGPDHRIILVPEIGGNVGFAQALAILGIGIAVPERWSRSIRDFRFATQGGSTSFTCAFDYLFDFNHRFRCAVPEYVNEQPAGASAPVQLSPWKIGALKVLALLEVRGWVDRHDVRRCGCDPRRFCATDGWLLADGERGRWTRGKLPPFEQQHPQVYAEILAKTREDVAA